MDMPMQSQKGLVSFDPGSHGGRTHVRIGVDVPQTSSLRRSMTDHYGLFSARRLFGDGVQKLFQGRTSVQERLDVIDRL